MGNPTLATAFGLLLAAPMPATGAEPPPPAAGFWYVQTSLHTRHFSADPRHNNRQELIGLEHHGASGRVYGAATFRNSFSQRAYYGYAGKRVDHAEYPLYLKVSGGLLQGYRGEYRDKIPLNRHGIAPVIIPALGIHHGRAAAEWVLLGFNAMLLTGGVRF